MEGSSLQAEVMRKVPELVVHERMSQGIGVKGFREEKRVSGWSTEEMKGKPSSSLEEDTEEMRKWRGMSQDEMDQCWKNLADKNGRGSSDQVRSRRKQKKRLSEVAVLFWNGEGLVKKQEMKVVRRLLGNNFLFV